VFGAVRQSPQGGWARPSQARARLCSGPRGVGEKRGGAAGLGAARKAEHLAGQSGAQRPPPVAARQHVGEVCRFDHAGLHCVGGSERFGGSAGPLQHNILRRGPSVRACLHNRGAEIQAVRVAGDPAQQQHPPPAAPPRGRCRAAGTPPEKTFTGGIWRLGALAAQWRLVGATARSQWELRLSAPAEAPAPAEALAGRGTGLRGPPVVQVRQPPTTPDARTC
jgi:hypothetical protein